MATVVSGSVRKPTDRDIRILNSDVEAVADTIELEGVAPSIPHTFIGVKFWTSAAGTTLATPGAGTVTVQVRTINSQIFEDIPDNVIDATGATTISVNGNVEEIRLVPAGITTATHWSAHVSQNRT